MTQILLTQTLFRWSFETAAPVRQAARRAYFDVALRPSVETAAALQRCGCWLRQDWDGVMLLSNRPYDVSNTYDALARCLDGMPMRFRLDADRARIASSSALPERAIGLPFFTSRHHRVVRESNAQGVTVDVIDLIPQPTQASCPEGELWLYPEDLRAALPASNWRARLDVLTRPWVYYVINRGQSTLKDPTIRDRQGASMNGPVPVHLQNGESAIRFDSGTQRYAMQPSADTVFSLYERNQSTWMADMAEVCLVRDLPVPDPHSVEWLDIGADMRICAAAYVYV